MLPCGTTEDDFEGPSELWTFPMIDGMVDKRGDTVDACEDIFQPNKQRGLVFTLSAINPLLFW